MIACFYRLFTRRITLDIYMKSGNVIRIDRVKDYSVENNSTGVTKIMLNQDKGGWSVLVSTLDLSQIEAIVHVGR